MSDRKLVAVPERMILSSELVEAVAFHCGDGKDNSYGDYQDGILFIGIVKDDEGRDVYGLHIASDECEEEGYSTLVEFEKPLPDYDVLAAQRDKGLAREAELKDAAEGYRVWGGGMRLERDALQQRLAKAQEILAKAIYRQWYDAPGYVPWVDGGDSVKQWEAREEAIEQLRDVGCADGEKS